MTFERVDLGDTVTLYLGDCLEVLPTLEAGSVDAVVTDPPYGIGFKYNLHDDTSEGYGQWLWSIIEQAESKCTPGAPVFVWQAMINCRHFSEWFQRDYRIFAACKNFVQMRPTAMQYAFDPVIVRLTPGCVTWSAGTLSRDYVVSDTSPASHVGINNVPGHPCPRPLGQVAHIIQQWVKPGTAVIDPFMGSGTTGVACVQTGRRFIGIEIDPTYFEIAVKRISDALKQPRLFDAPQPKPQQERML